MLDLQRELIGAREALEFQATHDGLTGLLNRSAVMQAMAQEMERVQRTSQALQIGLIDIDHFKQVNDTHGHLAGDAVLRGLAQRLEATLRPYDQVGRYGGEEFLVLVNSEIGDAQALCERLRSAIADQPFEHEQIALRITISGGFVPFTQQDTITASELLAVADKALYKAKATGRNRIVFDEGVGPTQALSNPPAKSALQGPV
jgi:diguanylate cyclase (GGDEF)-like protein